MTTPDKPRKLSHLAQGALDIVTLAQRRGRADLVLAEIKHALQAQARPGATVEKSSLSRELKHLSDDGLLLRRTSKRKPSWEVLPVGMKQEDSRSSFAYYAPGARAAAPVAAASDSSAISFY